MLLTKWSVLIYVHFLITGVVDKAQTISDHHLWLLDKSVWGLLNEIGSVCHVSGWAFPSTICLYATCVIPRVAFWASILDEALLSRNEV